MAYEGEIRNLITMRDFCDRYMIPVEKDKILCPFHDDSSPSCVLYPGNRGFYCFSCCTGGDVLKFAEKWFGLGLRDTMRRLNFDFSLNLPLDNISESDRKKSVAVEHERKKKIEEKERRIAEINNRYWTLFDTLQGIEMIIKAYKPVAMDVPLPSRYVDAIRRRDYIEYQLDCADTERKKITDNDYDLRVGL